jgi:phenylacetate-coenzyme A ligase PaaK-like adenylate-forming protein
MHLPDDLVIVEPVDANGEPVPAGQPAAKINLTNLYNHTQPLIRYEITDAMTLLDDPCPCGCAHRRVIDIQGHCDDVFAYSNGIVVQPIGLYTALEIAPEVTEFQIVQTPGGLKVNIRANTQFDTEPLRAELVRVMAASGLPDPQVTVGQVDALDRLWSGKLRRFVTLGVGAPDQST